MKSENEVRSSPCSEEKDRIPLKQRLKMLLASKTVLDFSDTSKECQTTNLSVGTRNSTDATVNNELESCILEDFNSTSQVGEEKPDRFFQKQIERGGINKFNSHGIVAETCTNESHIMSSMSMSNSTISRVENREVAYATLPHQFVPSKCSVMVEASDSKSMSMLQKISSYSAGVNAQSMEIKSEVSDDYFDEFDHIVLKERQRMLLSRKPFGHQKPESKDGSLSLSFQIIENKSKCNECIQKCGSHLNNEDFLMDGNNFYDAGRTSDSSSTFGLGPACQTCAPNACSYMQTGETKSRNSTSTQRSLKLCSHDSSALGSTMPAIVNVKLEPVENSELQFPGKDALDNLYSSKMVVKREPESLDDSIEVILDHMLLRERMKLLASSEVPKLNVSSTECLEKPVPSAAYFETINSRSSEPLKVIRPRKKRRTITDSIETALDEDAPGLLQVLIDKGVSINDIKLYGEAENDEALDESLVEESFSELEDVISMIFSRREKLLKFGPIRCPKGEKSFYCLACLFSLVEQARYLQFRKWPVEWGWCRDLQSFIFVFQRHNRIVLERPEYGYATYFFEFVESLPVDWQIKRLVIAMKITGCGRTTLIENKALVTGDDLSIGEARILMQYGWIPNTGLGTMLSYCDRVVHDRKNDQNNAEWRVKIGQLLKEGYNGGQIMTDNIPKKAMECKDDEAVQIKLEFSSEG